MDSLSQTGLPAGRKRGSVMPRFPAGGGPAGPWAGPDPRRDFGAFSGAPAGAAVRPLS